MFLAIYRPSFYIIYSPHKDTKLMKCGKTAGTSLIVAETLEACGDVETQQIRDLAEDIIH